MVLVKPLIWDLLQSSLQKVALRFHTLIQHLHWPQSLSRHRVPKLNMGGHTFRYERCNRPSHWYLPKLRIYLCLANFRALPSEIFHYPLNLKPLPLRHMHHGRHELLLLRL